MLVMGGVSIRSYEILSSYYSTHTNIPSSQRVAMERESDVRFNLLTVKANIDGEVRMANI